jgi:hypothetical protein
MVQRDRKQRRRNRLVSVVAAPWIDTGWVSERETRQTAPGGRAMRSSWFRIGALAAAALLTAGAGHGAVFAQTDGTPFEVSDFNQVQIEGAGHAIISIGSPAAITVSGPQDQISNLQVQVWFNTLEIEPNDDDNQSAGADLVYHITVPSLSQIELEGGVSAEVDGLTTDSLEITVEDNASLQLTKLSTQRLESQVEGNATVSITGSAESQQIEADDNAIFDALQVDSKTIEIEGQGNAHSKVRFSDSLNGQIEDNAVVEYMTESGTVSVEAEDAGTVTQVPFEALRALFFPPCGDSKSTTPDRNPGSFTCASAGYAFVAERDRGGGEPDRRRDASYGVTGTWPIRL